MKEESDKKEEKKELLYTSFNQDLKYFLVGTKDGCTIYNSEPFQKGFKLSKFLYFFIINYKNRTRRRIQLCDNAL